MTRRITFTGKHYRNDELMYWVSKTFNTKEEQDAAWQTVVFIRETWPETDDVLRGQLIGIDEGETE